MHRRLYRALASLALACTALVPGTALALNAIQVENALPGSPRSVWDIPTADAGDPSIVGFATDISVNKGETVHFKISAPASYHIDIYRLGYYGGDGARLQGTGVITATLPQTQPDPLTQPDVGLVDCGNWAESAHWDVPGGAVSPATTSRGSSATTRTA
jgi:hypothetical protein